MTPQEVWNVKKSYIAHIHVFGCIAYMMVSNEKNDKFNAKCTKCLFIGYYEGMRAYKVMSM